MNRNFVLNHYSYVVGMWCVDTDGSRQTALLFISQYTAVRCM